MAVIAAVVVPASAASAALPIDSRIPSNWAKWTFHSGGNYNLVIEADGFQGNGAAAQLYSANGGSNQLWFQEARLRYEYFLIKPYNDSGICVDVPWSNFTQGADLQLWGCNEGSAQYWQTGRCWAAACDGQWPDVTNCDTSGGDEVRDVSQGSNRLVLIRATGCHAFYARLTHGTNCCSDINLVMYRYHTDGTQSQWTLPVRTSTMRWSPMFGVDQAGATFEACAERPGDPGFRFCTGLWWV
ncbi:RICIN domain-containing protein [Phytohabitans suffuscus]|uniref:Uncharacterized protein n=1 Tax=Phytohabitans suffuscus TaxID=624315 RepID=A0A6F8YU76_9ACTN|nr:RICIN domain-containing protein [Phytohabitans suffuscus]BCB89672.1 hypothetical protein Psuf_069850 [Phytohabitans suffuscus]